MLNKPLTAGAGADAAQPRGEKLQPRQIILIHGSKRRISDLAYRLAPSYKIHTPAVGETVRTVLR